LNVLNRDFFKDILTEFYITYPLVAAQLKPAFEAFKELVGEADEDKKSLSNEINLPSMIFCSNEDVLQEGRYKPYFMGIQNFLIFESYTQGQALVRDKNISIILQQAYLAIELEQTEDAESLLLPLVKDTMNQKELEYLAYLETRLYLNSKEPKINSFVLNKFLNCIKFDLIENLKKKLLFESLAPQLENNAECTDFLKEIDDHGETISLKTDYFLAKIFKNNYSDLALGTKLTNLRRCLWSKFNVFKVDNRPHNHSQVK